MEIIYRLMYLATRPNHVFCRENFTVVALQLRYGCDGSEVNAYFECYCNTGNSV
jgi:hypothetical protein